MSKQLIAIAAAFVLMFAIAGCSSGSSSSASSNDQASASSASAAASAEASASSGSPLFTEQSWPADSRVVEGVPVPEFSVPIDTLNTSDLTVSATWKGVDDQEVVDYVSALQDAGFTYRVNESKSSSTYNYSARNNENTLEATDINLSYVAATGDQPSSLMIMVSRVN